MSPRNLFQWLLPREDRFRKLFTEDAANLSAAAKLLETIANGENPRARRLQASRLKELEHEGDEITRRIFDTLNTTFLTPLDREDIRDLATALDDVLDEMEAVSRWLVQFRLEEAPDELVQMSSLLRAATEEIVRLTELVWDPARAEEAQQSLIHISELENRADAIFNLAVSDLFDPAAATDPVEIMKWKQVYESLEASIDRCKAVAHAVGNIVTKHG